MSWLDSVGQLLKQYTSGGAATAPAPNVHEHFDKVVQAAPSSAIAEVWPRHFVPTRHPRSGGYFRLCSPTQPVIRRQAC